MHACARPMCMRRALPCGWRWTSRPSRPARYGSAQGRRVCVCMLAVAGRSRPTRWRACTSWQGSSSAAGLCTVRPQLFGPGDAGARSTPQPCAGANSKRHMPTTTTHDLAMLTSTLQPCGGADNNDDAMCRWPSWTMRWRAGWARPSTACQCSCWCCGQSSATTRSASSRDDDGVMMAAMKVVLVITVG